MGRFLYLFISFLSAAGHPAKRRNDCCKKKTKLQNVKHNNIKDVTWCKTDLTEAQTHI